MEFAAGGELYDYLSERKILAEDEARRLFRQIATAVYYCHKVNNAKVANVVNGLPDSPRNRNRNPNPNQKVAARPPFQRKGCLAVRPSGSSKATRDNWTNRRLHVLVFVPILVRGDRRCAYFYGRALAFDFILAAAAAFYEICRIGCDSYMYVGYLLAVPPTRLDLIRTYVYV